MKVWIAALLYALSIGTAAAGPFEDGIAAAQRGDYATGLRLWKPLAVQGDMFAHTT